MQFSCRNYGVTLHCVQEKVPLTRNGGGYKNNVIVMAEDFIHIVNQVWELMNEMSPYLLLGFLLAGLMHAFVPGSMYSRYLSAGNFRSVLYGALLGIPLPLCSCGVIPTSMSLRREGASHGATISFLIATPQTGIDSIAATYSLMGLPFAIIRPIAALFTAIFGGQMVNVIQNDDDNVNDNVNVNDNDDDNDKGSFVSKLKEALNYAFIEMMEDIGKWLVVGLVVAGLITILVPDSFFAVFKGNTLLSMLLVLCIAIPMYICATGSIPIAVALMMKGLTPGAALVLLMAGPACNMASILVINKVMGRRTLITYLASIISGSIAFGFCIDHLLPTEWFTPNMMHGDAYCHEEGAGWFSIGCTILLLLLLAHALWNRLHGHHHCHCGEEHEGHCHCGEEHEGHCNCGNHCHCSEEQESKAGGKKMYFHIKGMNCNHCRTNAQKALESLPGVTRADVDLASGMAIVEGETTMEEARKAIESLGFSIVAE